MKKRVISFLLVAVMAFGLGAPAYASAGDADAKIDTSNITVEGTNDVGKLLANEMRENNVSGAGGNHISGLTVDGSIATVELVTDRAGEVVVAVYDEDGGQMLSSGNASVAAGTETVSVTIEGPVPQYFVATAFLLDAAGHEPLCEEYTTSLHTKEMQDFVDTDVNDYDPDLVLNLDADPSTNFMVYSEKTIVVRENGQTNVLADNGDGTYTVTNADETFTSLSAGDTFSYEQNDGNIKLVKVASVSVDGTTVTIQEDDTMKMGDFFDLVKIEVGEEEPESEVAPVDLNADRTVKRSVTVELGSKDSVIHVSGTLDVSLHFKLYASLSYHYAELTATAKLTASLSFGGKLPLREYTLANLKFYPLPVLSIGVEPKFVVEASGKLDLSATVKTTIGFAIENFSIQNKCKEPEVEYDVKLEGKLYIGIKMGPKVELCEGVAEVSASFGEGYEIKASTSMLQDKGGERHLCTLCFDIGISRKTSLSGKVSLFWGLINFEDKIELSDNLGEFYYSTDFEEFGSGECPHKEYRVTMTVQDENGKPIQGANVHRHGNYAFGDEGEPVTNENGVAEFYLPNGKYKFTISFDGVLEGAEVEIDGSAVEINVVFSLSVPEATPEPGVGEFLASGECGAEGDNVQWYLTNDGTLTIYGKGMMADYYHYNSNEVPSNAAPWYSYREQIVSAVVKDGVTNIGNYVFDGCTSLASVSIPDGVTLIGGAFYECTSLALINIPNGVTEISGSTFSRCTGLTTINIPDSVTYIGSSAFYACHSLTTISIPDSMTGIGNDAFASCTSLTTVSIPDSVTEIGSGAFYGCTSLALINIPNGVTEISGSTFSRCTGLTTINIPDSVTYIGSSAFYACHSLTTISIPDSMTYIGSVAFCECTGLTSIDIPDSVTYIGQYAFQDCHSLTSISIADGVTEISDYVFDACTHLTSISIPDGVTSIGNGAFYGCHSLASIDIPDSVTEIGVHAFRDCRSLTSISIPDSVTKIDYGAFDGCTSLTTISIPDSVISIGHSAFDECDSLADVYYSGSPEQWSAIQIDNLNNEDLTGANIHYNSTGPEDAADAMALVMAAEPEETVQPDETATPSVESANEPTTVPETTATPGASAVPELTVTPEPTATPEPAVTPEPSAGPTPGPSPEPATTPEPTEIAPLRASQEEEDGVVVPVSAFDGTSDGHTALFTGLMPGEDYAVVVAVDLGAAGLLSASNLLYIAQVPADNNGAIALSYIPRIDSAASVRAFGPTCEHVWNGGEVTVDATCTAHGEKMYTCTICGQKKTEPTDALGHLKPEDGSLIKTTKEATCTVTGEMEYTCERCQETVTEELPALGHAWDEGRVTKEPAAGEKGVKTYTCTRCGETKTEEIPAKSVPAGDVKTTAAPGTAPDTGDEALLTLYAGILVLCLGGLVVIPTLKKRVR